MITISADQIERAEILLKRVPNGAPKAVVAALNRASQGARTDAIKKARERYHIKAKDVRNTMQITKATYNDMTTTIRASGSPIALSRFKISPTKPVKRRKKPVVARVVRGAGGPIVKVFVARVKSGHVGVFKRAGKSRLPIKQLYGPSVPQMLGHESVTKYLEEKALERLEERFEHEISRLLRGVGK